MTSDLAFQRLEATDLLDIDRQESQLLWLGTPGDITEDAAQLLADEREAWTAWAAGRIVACFGISELFEGKHGVAWALLSGDIGKHHLPVSRFIKAKVEASDLARIEVLVRGREIDHGRFDPVELQQENPSPEFRWAALLGFEPAHVLRNFGAASETYVLFERIAMREGEG